MKRTIKFRRPYFRISDNEFGYFDYWGVDIELRKGIKVFISPGNSSHHYGGDDQQFTGLFDKNGVEIYEGDIIRYPNPKCWGVIEFGEYHWSEYDESETGIGFYINRKDKYRISTITTSDQNVIEKIGDIYSNPELL